METCDVLIVGGGPAGSSCAAQLNQAGLDVLVLDKQAFPRDKPCAGWITPQVVESLRIDLDQYRVGRTLQPILGFRCGLIGGDDVETRYGQPISYGIRRCEFDSYLLERSGARCRLQERVKSLERESDSWIVNGRYSAPLLVGAGGHFCPVARSLGAREKRDAAVVVAQEIEFHVQSEQTDRVRVCPEIPEIFFCRDLLGYGWCFRKGNLLNIGLGRVGGQDLSRHVTAFCDFLRTREKVRCDIPARFVGHAYQLYAGSLPKLFDDRVLLVGDAAGLAYPQSGEGIRPAVESGLIAADVILRAAGDYSTEKLGTYQSRLIERFGKPGAPGPLKWLPAAWLYRAAARLLATHWFSRHVVMDRWFLHANQAALRPPKYDGHPCPSASWFRRTRMSVVRKSSRTVRKN